MTTDFMGGGARLRLVEGKLNTDGHGFYGMLRLTGPDLEGTPLGSEVTPQRSGGGASR
ncbi:hypothetical protein CLV84_0908 [Neolewinella xylanilytica]|uniref:Uncharacterized protein n=1 Tax=Neolewinella xylanilytica TaxID=1514080 RepID=A0A2S6I8Z7_9BACT|nr:hypothetical protein [Neolewinella xylanilytica]PPK87949.1 hypothetical protein CLV84_0908 [Neolewinella xylanilytica]